MKVQTINITAEGELGRIPDVAGLIQSCVKMNIENGKAEGRETGDFYYEGLHVTYSYAERVVDKGGRKKKEEEAEE